MTFYAVLAFTFVVVVIAAVLVVARDCLRHQPFLRWQQESFRWLCRLADLQVFMFTSLFLALSLSLFIHVGMYTYMYGRVFVRVIAACLPFNWLFVYWNVNAMTTQPPGFRTQCAYLNNKTGYDSISRVAWQHCVPHRQQSARTHAHIRKYN